MNFKFKKRFGQNFIKQENIVKKISSVIGEKKGSLVIEIGCGDGRLTKELCNDYERVLGYEIDKEVIPYLYENLKDFNNCKVICDDFLKRNLKDDLKSYKYDNLYVFGNLPYYITTPIIEKLITSDIDISKMVFMVQKEVGDRFCASPKTKEYGSLTVYLNYYFDIKKEFEVGRGNFVPVPNVDSIVISFTKKESLKLKDEKLFFKLVKDSFRFKRKTIRNNLEGYDLDKISNVLSKYGYDLSVRAEELPLDVFVDISNNL